MATGSILLLIIAIALIFIIIACARWKWHPIVVLLIAAIFTGISCGLSLPKTMQTMLDGAGNVFAAIGFIIVFGTLLGEILEKSGGAASLAMYVIKTCSGKTLLPATGLIGWMVGIPVFCDSGFIILNRLVQAMAGVSGQNAGALQLSLATGLYTSHVLIPPTPGPMAAAGNLGLSDSLGWVIVLGVIVSLPAVAAGIWISSRMGNDHSTESPVSSFPAGYQPGMARKSLLILLLPLLLIASAAIFPGLAGIGHPVLALSLTCLLALLLLASKNKKEWPVWMTQAVTQAGPIILITSAGGAFGAILKAIPLQEKLATLLQQGNIPLIAIYPLAFLLTAILKTAQGSSTAALIIGSAMIYPILGAFQLTIPQMVLVLLSISGGAMTISHANDSYFWVINQYGRIPVHHLYKYYSAATAVMGITVLFSCMILHYIIG